jgi:hypothetical protein
MSSPRQKNQKKDPHGRGIKGVGPPVNLAIRFLLELAALIILGLWGWRFSNNMWLQYAMAISTPGAAAAIWGIFNVPNDPSRSGNAPIVVPGFIRFIIELLFFAVATWALHDLGYMKLSLTYGVVVVVHYLVSYDRIMWLLKH